MANLHRVSALSAYGGFGVGVEQFVYFFIRERRVVLWFVAAFVRCPSA
jgi:hypothetical protein